MAKDSAKYLACQAELRKYQAQAIAAQAWVTMGMACTFPESVELNMGDTTWTALIMGASKPHGGIVVFLDAEGRKISDPATVDDQCTNLVRSTCPYARQAGRTLLIKRDDIAKKAGK